MPPEAGQTSKTNYTTVKSPIRSISFIGLGLIGMSLLRAIKHSPLALENKILFQGFDPNFTDCDRESVETLGLDRFTADKTILCPSLTAACTHFWDQMARARPL